MPVTVYNISSSPLRLLPGAKRYCDLMVEAGVLEYTSDGLVHTEKVWLSDWYFKALFEMPQW